MPEHEKTVLVIGAGGMLGHMAMRVLSTNHRTYGTTRSSKEIQKKLSNFLQTDQWIENIDARNTSQVERVVGELKPDVILNCVGLVKQKMDATSYVESIEINALLPHKLSQIASDHGSKFIQISTDCVFTCQSGIKNQGDEPNARDLYGITKSIGEINYGDALTIRTSIVGRQLSGHESLFEWAINQRGKTIKGYRNALYSGLTTSALCDVIDFLIRERMDLRGVWQVSSQEISKFDLLVKLNELLSLDIDVAPDNDFLCDRRLDGNPFRRETGYRIPTWDEMLHQFSGDEKNYVELDQSK